MIELGGDLDYVYMIGIALIAGGIGGVAAELLIQRAGNRGTVELPGRLARTRLVDIGYPANIVLGGIAAVAILYFFPPVIPTITPGTGGGEPIRSEEYDLVKLIALSLIVGSAGPAFLASAQSRVMSALNAQKADTAVETGKKQIDQVVESAKAAVPAAVQAALAEHISTATPDDVKAISDSTVASMATTLEPQVAVARGQIESIAHPTDRFGNAR